MSIEYIVSRMMGCAFIEEGEPDPVYPDWTGKTAVFLGDSVTRGYNASPLTTERWTYKLASALGGTEDNYGVDGMTLQSGCVATFSTATIPAYNSSIHAAVFFGLGTNDIGQNNGTGKTAAAYGTLLGAVIDHMTGTKGWPVDKIYISTPYYSINYNAWIGSCSVSVAATQTLANSYRDQALSVATAKGVHGINIMQLMIDAGMNSGDFAPDGAHPNNGGYTKIKNLYLGVLAL